MASFSKRHGKWQARVNWTDSFGKRHFKSKNGFATKALARKWAVQAESDLNNGFKVASRISLAAYFKHWVQVYKQPKLSRISLDRYRITGNDIQSFFGDTPINKITRSNYQQFINQYGAAHAPSSVKKENGFIRACVKSAILDGYLAKDFTQGITKVANKNRTVKVDYLSLKEIKALVNITKSKLNVHNPGRYMILTAIYTGMRLSEIQALTWKDIDFAKRTISITKSWDAVAHRFKPTKNESSVRTIKVNQELLVLLHQLKNSATSNMVFFSHVGTIPTSNAVNKLLRNLLDELGLKKQGFHFHSLRHSHVALLLAEGIDLYAISKRLGHNNISTTANTYAYLLDEYRDKTDLQIIKALSNL